jgi:hypothetical protein
MCCHVVKQRTGNADITNIRNKEIIVGEVNLWLQDILSGQVGTPERRDVWKQSNIKRKANGNVKEKEGRAGSLPLRSIS